MATLKSTLKIESTDIFPTPVNFTAVNNNNVAGDFSGFNTVAITATPAVLNFLGAVSVTGAYVYVSAASTNAHPVFVGSSPVVTPMTTTLATLRLAPGDVAFFPAGNVGACNVSAICAVGLTGTISYFIGEKSA